MVWSLSQNTLLNCTHPPSRDEPGLFPNLRSHPLLAVKGSESLPLLKSPSWLRAFWCSTVLSIRTRLLSVSPTHTLMPFPS